MPLADQSPELFSLAEYRRRRSAVVAEVIGAELSALVVSDPSDLIYLTGYGGVSSLGPNPFAGSVSSALVVTCDDQWSLLAGEPDLAFGSPSLAREGLDLTVYPTFNTIRPLFPRDGFGDAVAEAVRGRRPIGWQESSLPLAAARALLADRAPADCREAGDLVAQCRWRKSEPELERVKVAVAACDAAHAALASEIRDGLTVSDVRTIIYSELERFSSPVTAIIETTLLARTEVSVSGDLSVGDALVVDIAPRINGYWGDSCETYVIGDSDAAPEFWHARTAALGALDVATAGVRPGVCLGELDAAIRGELERRGFPRPDGGAGHGVGIDFHESPRLVPSETAGIEPGMVLAIEPAAVLDRGLVRVEHLVLVTEHGSDVLSRHLSDMTNRDIDGVLG